MKLHSKTSTYLKALGITSALLISSSSFSAPDIVTEFNIGTSYTNTKLTHDLDISIEKMEDNFNIGFDPDIIKGPLNHSLKLKSQSLHSKLSFLCKNNVYIEGFASYGILTGKMEESLNTTKLTDKAFLSKGDFKKKKSKKGNTLSMLFSIGYSMELCEQISIVPMLGLSHSSIRVKKIYDFDHLSSLPVNQKISWSGPFIGLRIPISIDPKFQVELSCNYHIANYKSTMNSNGFFPTGFGRYCYEGKKKGHVIDSQFQVKYSFTPSLFLEFDYQYSYKQVKPSNMNVQFLPEKLDGLSQQNIAGLIKGSGIAKGKVKQQDHCFSIGLNYQF